MSPKACAACLPCMHCCPTPERWQTRAQVWLGTLVEVSLLPQETTEARFARAFAAIAHVHQHMNAHDPASDLGRIARHAHHHSVRVARETHVVLELAQELAAATHGRFDVSAAAARPRTDRLRLRRPQGLGARALHLGPGRRVRTERPLTLDLSGIAKGYAVDHAVAALRADGASAGLVNAGGDLRVFGPGLWMPVRVRLPQRPTQALPLFEVQDAAVASSADYFRDGGAALFDPRAQRARGYAGSISVVAPSCVLADALTKVVALMPAQAAPLLARYGAHALRIDAAGTRCATTLHTPTAHVRLRADALA
jgi:thiamine biosynthesis lipoprotein